MERNEKRDGRTNGGVWIGVAILLASQLAAAVALRSGATSEGAVAAAAALIAAGTLGVAATRCGRTAWPRPATWAAGLAMAAAILLSPLSAGSPEHWVRHCRDLAWLLPWSLVLMSITPAPARGACSPGSRWAGPALIGMGVALGVLLHVAALAPL